MPPPQEIRPLTRAEKAKIIDEFGECDRLLRLWKPQTNPHQARYSELEAEILSWSANDPPEKSTVLTGKVYQAEVGPQGFKRTFTQAAQRVAYELLSKIEGLDIVQFFSITQAEAKRLLGRQFLDTHVPKLQTGPRGLSVVPRRKAVPAARKAA